MQTENEVWQQAVESERGLKLRFENSAAAWHYRARLYSAREKSRRENRKIFAPDNPMHGRSFYEDFVIKIERADGTPVKTPAHSDGPTFVIVVKQDTTALQIERL